MMRCLRDNNVDNNLVGWYQIGSLGSFFSDATIETQVTWQLNLNKCVVISYDPFRTSPGALALKAFRLSEAFVELHRQHPSFSQGDLLKMNKAMGSQIFEEIPIVIRNSHLVNACLYEFEDSKLIDKSTSSPLDVLDLSTNPFLEKNLESLIDSIDYLKRSFIQQHAYRQKRKVDNAARRQAGEEELPEEEENFGALMLKSNEQSHPNPLPKTNQINYCVQQIKQFSGQSFSKLFLLNGLNKE